jgi:hypothetical protein
MGKPMTTPDIAGNWLNIARRLQSVSKTNNGAAIISITIVIDQNGNPCHWTEPDLKKIEPMARASEFLKYFTQ